jgi:hypothetical protein
MVSQASDQSDEQATPSPVHLGFRVASFPEMFGKTTPTKAHRELLAATKGNDQVYFSSLQKKTAGSTDLRSTRLISP